MTNSNAGVKVAIGSAALDGRNTHWFRVADANRYAKDVKAKLKAANSGFQGTSLSSRRKRSTGSRVRITDFAARSTAVCIVDGLRDQECPDSGSSRT